MGSLLDFPFGYEEDYEPASVEFSLAQARAMLGLLYRHTPETIREVGVGTCEDCSNTAILLAYQGKRNLCRSCARRRRLVAVAPDQAAPPTTPSSSPLVRPVGHCQRCWRDGALQVVGRRFFCSACARRSGRTQGREDRAA